MRSPFQRTPKYNLDNRTGPEKALDYLLPRDYGVWIELALSIYSFALLLLAVRFGNWGLIFWLSLFSAGYAYISGLGFLQAQVKKRLLPSARDVFPASSRPNLGQD